MRQAKQKLRRIEDLKFWKNNRFKMQNSSTTECAYKLFISFEPFSSMKTYTNGQTDKIFKFL